MYVCMYVCMYVLYIYVCMYVLYMYVCMFVRIYIYRITLDTQKCILSETFLDIGQLVSCVTIVIWVRHKTKSLVDKV
jgi:hypothetical protein